MLRTALIHHLPAARLRIVILVAGLGGGMLELGARVEIVMKAAGIPKNATGIGGFVNGAHALVTPALVMVAAVAPIGLIAGGVVMMFGGRRGMQMVGTSLGVLLLLGSVTALID